MKRPAARLMLFLGAALCLPGQRMFDMETKAGDEARQVFEKVWTKQSGDPENSCQVRIYEPRLDFGLNLWTGWNADFPIQAGQVAERDQLVNVLRVTPKDGGAPFYFGSSEWLQRVPKELAGEQKLVITSGGGLRLGPGKYQVEWMLAHHRAGVCRKTWTLNAKATGGIKPTLAAGQVREAMFNAWRGFEDQQGMRATILMHAAPMRRRRNVNRLSAWERNMMLSMLRTVLDRGHIREARVVVFDLEQGRTFFETESITREGYFQLARELAQVDYGTIDIQAYQRGEQHWPYLEEKLRQELAREKKPDSLIFIGPSTEYGGRPPADLRAFKSRFPEVFYLALTPLMTVAQDQISQLVRALDGKVFTIWEPKDLAKAVARIREETITRPGPGS